MSRRYFGGIRDRIKQRARFLNLTDADYQWVKIKGAFDWRSKRITFEWEEPKDYLSSFLKKSDRVFSQEEENGEDPALNDSLRWLYAGTEGRSPESMMPPRTKQDLEQNYLPPDVGIEADLPDLDEYKAEIVSALRRRNIKVGTDKISLPEDLEKELFAYHTGHAGEVDTFELRSRLQQFKKQVIDASEQFSNLKGVGGLKVDTPPVLSDSQPIKEEAAPVEQPPQEATPQEPPVSKASPAPEVERKTAEPIMPAPIHPNQNRPRGERLDKDRLGGDRIASNNGLPSLQDAPHMRPRVVEKNDPPDLEDTQPESPYAPPSVPPPAPEVEAEKTFPIPQSDSQPIDQEAKDAVLRAFNAKKNGMEDAEAAAKALAERIKRNEEDADATSVSINAILPPLDAIPIYEDGAPPPAAEDIAPEADLDEVVSGDTIDLSEGDTFRLKRALEALEGPTLSLEEEAVPPPAPPQEPPVAELATEEEPETAEQSIGEDGEQPEVNGTADLKLVKKPGETLGDATAVLLQNILEEVDQEVEEEAQLVADSITEIKPPEPHQPMGEEPKVEDEIEVAMPGDGDVGRSQYIQDQRAKLYLLINKLEEESGISDHAGGASPESMGATESDLDHAKPSLDEQPTGEAEQLPVPEVSSPESSLTEPAALSSDATDEFEQLEAALSPDGVEPASIPAEPAEKIEEERLPSENAAETTVDISSEVESAEEELAQSQPVAETPVSESIPAESPEAPMDKPEDAFAEEEVPAPEGSAEKQETAVPEVTAERPLWEESIDEELEASMAVNEEDNQPESVEAKKEEAAPVVADAQVVETPATADEAATIEELAPPEAAPEKSEQVSIESMLEVLAFASDEPVPLKKVARIYAEFTGDRAPTEAKLLEAVDSLNASYAKELRTFRIKVWANGVRMATEPAYSAYVRKLYHQEQQKKLSRTLMETLAIVAYSQPITKPELDFVRGVDSDYAVRKLLEMGLVDIVGRSDSIGRPLLYGTSERFLDQFGLSGLEALPKLREIEDLLGDPAFSKERMHLLALENLDARLGAQAEGAEGTAVTSNEETGVEAGEEEVKADVATVEPEAPVESEPAPEKPAPAKTTRSKSKSGKAKPKSEPPADTPPPAE